MLTQLLQQLGNNLVQDQDGNYMAPDQSGNYAPLTPFQQSQLQPPQTNSALQQMKNPAPMGALGQMLTSGNQVTPPWAGGAIQTPQVENQLDTKALAQKFQDAMTQSHGKNIDTEDMQKMLGMFTGNDLGAIKGNIQNYLAKEYGTDGSYPIDPNSINSLFQQTKTPGPVVPPTAEQISNVPDGYDVKSLTGEPVAPVGGAQPSMQGGKSEYVPTDKDKAGAPVFSNAKADALMKQAEDQVAKAHAVPDPERGGAHLNPLQLLGLALPAILTGRSGYIGRGLEGYNQGREQAYQQAMAKKQQQQALYMSQAKDLINQATQTHQADWAQHQEDTSNYYKNLGIAKTKADDIASADSDTRKEGIARVQKFVDQVEADPKGSTKEKQAQYKQIIDQYEGAGGPFKKGELSAIVPMLSDGTIGAKGQTVKLAQDKFQELTGHRANADELKIILGIGSGNMTPTDKAIAYSKLRAMGSGGYKNLTDEDIDTLSTRYSATEEGKKAQSALAGIKGEDITKTQPFRIDVMKANAAHMNKVTSLLDDQEKIKWTEAQTHRMTAISANEARDNKDVDATYNEVVKTTEAQRKLIKDNIHNIRVKYLDDKGVVNEGALKANGEDSGKIEALKTAEETLNTDLRNSKETYKSAKAKPADGDRSRHDGAGSGFSGNIGDGSGDIPTAGPGGGISFDGKSFTADVIKSAQHAKVTKIPGKQKPAPQAKTPKTKSGRGVH